MLCFDIVHTHMQDKCNSSYAFSAIAALEGASALLTGEPVPFSEQNILDCTGKSFAT
jgi:hypothetical protein